MMSFIAAHPTIVALAVYVVFGALVGGMPAPTANSGTAYRWTFASLNILASNVSRAWNTALETSPNWQAAVAKYASQPPTAETKQ